LDFKSKEDRERYWHTTSHILAQAVKHLFPDAKLGIGPAIEQGFYYDFDIGERTFTPEDLEAIETRMREIVKSDFPLTCKMMGREDAIRFFNDRDEPYKVELIERIEDDQVSTYSQDGFTDLCKGPHMERTGEIGEVKVLTSSGAYWLGHEDRPMMQRIYGISFPTAEMMEEFLNGLDEARARDHRKLGKELDLFSMPEELGTGLVIWHPKGAVMRQVIEDFWREEHVKEGYQLVISPHIGRSTLWETSGHLDFYREHMYPAMEFDSAEYFVKPMNCPFHMLIYRSELRSYRDLPIRYAEMGSVYRYEMSGALHGLMRVRGLTIDDAHIFCTPEQLEDEVIRTLSFTTRMLGQFGFKEYEIYISTKPEKAVGDAQSWEDATAALIRAVEKSGHEYETDEGGGAFYGPKIDVKIRDALRRTWQCSTIQFDFNLPEKFDLTYRDSDGSDKRPYTIHRALLGSVERFFGVLVEHYGGNFPVWLAPVQVVIMPITDDQMEYAESVRNVLRDRGIRVELDARNEKVGYKIAEAERQKIPYMLIVGKKEVEAGTVSVRRHQKGDLGQTSLDEFTSSLEEEIKKREMETKGSTVH
jgi:threonyl-tRNA synthetase